MRMMWGLLLGVVILAADAGLGAAPAAADAGVPVEGRAAQNNGDWECVQVTGGLELNIRSGPGVNYDVVSSRPTGDQIDADYSRAQTASDGYEWVPVRYLNGEGWTITARLRPCPTGDAADSGEMDGINRDGILDRSEIAQVAHSVVLIANVQNDRIYATGTGTITSPDGLIVTNAHVVEGSEQVAVALLDDINDPPEYRYLGEVINYDLDTDVALIAIRYDIDGVRVLSADLSLPYIPALVAAADVFRGDEVYIFGYPGIGDDYLVVTTGSIVSVENGEVNGERMPIWYRTDAEIAPGNSGGLVVNGNGEFIGIPTFVRAESETGGRLGGIRPAQVAMMAIMDDQTLVAEAPALVVPSPGGDNAVQEDPYRAEVSRVELFHGAEVNDQPGIDISLVFVLFGWAERDAAVVARVYYDDNQSTPLVNAAAPELYRDQTGSVLTSEPITPCCEETHYDDFHLFLPYGVFGLTEPGTYAFKLKVEVVSSDETLRRLLSWEYISLTLQ
ncbi:MAG: trypsin-like peptidase domain-containing protein [Anaerolineae bacterium]|nr:trypsin-like peptidase domain-containing protein [Anaerolineae bacterium]